LFRPVLHLALHVAVPVGLALAVAYPRWARPALYMLAALAIDLDHLLATPIYDPDRCSIGFHPLHTWPAWLLYLALTAHPRTRWFGIGAVIHMLLDALDCWWMHGFPGLA
jgi:hypothetical protein